MKDLEDGHGHCHGIFILATHVQYILHTFRSLDNNKITSLPAGVFSGLSNIHRMWVYPIYSWWMKHVFEEIQECLYVIYDIYIYIYIILEKCIILNGLTWGIPYDQIPPRSRSRSRSRSRTIYFSNISRRKMNNSSQPSFTQHPYTNWRGWIYLAEICLQINLDGSLLVFSAGYPFSISCESIPWPWPWPWPWVWHA